MKSEFQSANIIEFRFVEWYGGPEFSAMQVSKLLSEVQEMLSNDLAPCWPTSISKVFFYTYFVGTIEDWGSSFHPNKTVKRIWMESEGVLCVSMYVRQADVSTDKILLTQRFLANLRIVIGSILRYLHRKKTSFNEDQIFSALSKIERKIINEGNHFHDYAKNKCSGQGVDAPSAGIRFEATNAPLWISQQVDLLNLISTELLPLKHQRQSVTIHCEPILERQILSKFIIREEIMNPKLLLNSDLFDGSYLDLQSTFLRGLEEIAFNWLKYKRTGQWEDPPFRLLRTICERYAQLHMMDKRISTDEDYLVESQFRGTGKLHVRKKNG